MRKTVYALTIVFVGLVVVMGVSPSFRAASADGKVVKILGEEGFNANSRVFATFRFSPGNVHINQGDIVTFENLITPDPHTISIIAESDLPTNIEQVFQCGAPGTVCAGIFAAHIPNGFGPNGEPNPPVIPFVNVAGNPSGFEQGNVQGNSLLLPFGQTAGIIVSAESGTNLHYFCAIHAWMQGEIFVK